MSHTISYANATFLEAEARAIEDCRFWLGDRFDKLVSDFRRELRPDQEKAFLFYIEFAGIRGYPAHAMYRHCFPFG